MQSGIDLMNIIILTKRQYTNKDLIDDKFGRIRNLPFELSILKHTVMGICLSYRKKKEKHVFDGSVEWRSINAGPLKIYGLYQFYRQAKLNASNMDIIWASSDSIYGVIGYLLSRKYKIPCVFDLYDNYEYFLLARLPVMKQLYRWVVKNSDGVTCVSEPLARLVTSYGRDKPLFVLENAVQHDVFKPLDKKECRRTLNLPVKGRFVGTAGTLHSNRGILGLFDAFDSLKDKYPDLHLVLAGPCHVHIPSDRRIIYLGNLPESKVPLVLNTLDVAVVCNIENEFGKYCFPQKAREIMACNTPLIGARVGAMQDILTGFPEEWLFKPNDKTDMARAIESRLHDESTNYTNIKSWTDIAAELEKYLFGVIKRAVNK